MMMENKERLPTLKEIAVWLFHTGKYVNIEIVEDKIYFKRASVEFKIEIVFELIFLEFIKSGNTQQFRTYEELTEYLNF